MASKLLVTPLSVSCYLFDKGVCRWVLEKVYYKNFEKKCKKVNELEKKMYFVKDDEIPDHLSPLMKDFQNGPEFHNGHLRAAGNVIGDWKSFKLTYKTSNVAIMLANFNTGVWKRAENSFRRLIKAHKDGEAFIISGTCHQQRRGNLVKYKALGAGARKIHVATHFFKALTIYFPNTQKQPVTKYFFFQHKINKLGLKPRAIKKDVLETKAAVILDDILAHRTKITG